MVRSLGDIDEPVFLRSAAKPFIAAAVVASGAAERFGFTAPEIAVMAASHNGEPFHVAAVASMLEKIGLDASALRCGAHPPSYEPAAAELARAGVAATALHNNCSGKHAGILALCRQSGDDLATYRKPGHPAQRRILAFCARLTGDDPAQMPLGVDGCGIPVFATPLRRAARAFARFATFDGVGDEDGAALRVVRDAMTAAPAYVAGSERFESALIAATHGYVVGKAGAEGVHADALLRAGLGLALKVVDGSRRAVPPATMALLGEVGAFEAREHAALESFRRIEIRNVAGDGVGFVTTEPDTIGVPLAS